MSTQFRNVRTQASGIRAWGDLEGGCVVVELQVSAGEEATGGTSRKSLESDIHISDVYTLKDGEWLAKFGTIKSLSGLSNKQVPSILDRLQSRGKFGTTAPESQWENICISDGKVIFTDDLKNEKPRMWVVEDKPFAGAVKKLERIDLPVVTDDNPEEGQELDEWLDEIIGIISEIADATPEQLQELGKSLNLIGKELEDSGLDEEVDSLVETIESDEEDEMVEQFIQEIKKGNKPLVNFFADLASKADSEPKQKPGIGKLSMEDVMKKQKEFFETPIKPNESLIANKIMQEAAEKISETCRVNEEQRHSDAIADMIQKMELMSTEEIEKLWDMWTLRQERLANQNKPKLIPKKPKPEPALSDNDWEKIDASWEKDEKRYWEEMKELRKELEEMKELEEKLDYTPPSKTWGPNKKIYSKGEQEMTEQEIAKGRKRQEDFLDRILDEIVFCEPMSPEDLKKKWENAWKDINKEWGRRAMKRRHKEQEESSRRDLFQGLSGKTPPWPMMNPRDPEFWEPEF